MNALRSFKYIQCVGQMSNAQLGKWKTLIQQSINLLGINMVEYVSPMQTSLATKI